MDSGHNHSCHEIAPVKALADFGDSAFSGATKSRSRNATAPYGRAFGVLVLSFAGHYSESAGKAISLPVMRSIAMA